VTAVHKIVINVVSRRETSKSERERRAEFDITHNKTERGVVALLGSVALNTSSDGLGLAAKRQAAATRRAMFVCHGLEIRQTLAALIAMWLRSSLSRWRIVSATEISLIVISLITRALFSCTSRSVSSVRCLHKCRAARPINQPMDATLSL
jgi:hypothetical protein